MRTRSIDVTGKSPMGLYCADITHKTKNLRNVANYIIRNTMTGIQKSPETRTHNETEVLHLVFTCTQKAVENAYKRIDDCIREAKQGHMSGLARHAFLRKNLLKIHIFTYPTKEKWYIGYEHMDAILKLSKNPDYYALPSQVNQQALKKTAQSWTAYFKSMKKYHAEPSAYKGMSRIPGYIREAHATAHVPKQRLRQADAGENCRFLFPGTALCMDAGRGIAFDTIVKTEIMPWYGGYRILVTYGKKEEEPKAPKRPKRILGLDPGVNNFLTGTYNFETEPFIISGKHLKEENQWFNKQRAKLLSALTKGKDSTRSQKHSKNLDALSRNRSNRFDDLFYKMAHCICRECVRQNVQAVVFGHNREQKQNVQMGGENNQNFVNIPYDRFRQILKTVALRYRIPLIFREESYTSKASLMDGDAIPTYGDADASDIVFSGTRTKRGVYVSKDGIEVNADVNSAGNILRKEYPYAFDDIKDWSFLYRTVKVFREKELYGQKQVKKKDRSKPEPVRKPIRLKFKKHRLPAGQVPPSQGIAGTC